MDLFLPKCAQEDEVQSVSNLWTKNYDRTEDHKCIAIKKWIKVASQKWKNPYKGEVRVAKDQTFHVLFF